MTTTNTTNTTNTTTAENIRADIPAAIAAALAENGKVHYFNIDANNPQYCWLGIKYDAMNVKIRLWSKSVLADAVKAALTETTTTATETTAATETTTATAATETTAKKPRKARKATTTAATETTTATAWWKIEKREAIGRIVVTLAENAPSNAKKAVEDAGFFYSKVTGGYNKKIGARQEAAAAELAKVLAAMK